MGILSSLSERTRDAVRAWNALRIPTVLPSMEALDARRLLTAGGVEAVPWEVLADGTVSFNATDGDDDVRLVVDRGRGKVGVFGIAGIADGSEFEFNVAGHWRTGGIDLHTYGGDDEIVVELVGYRAWEHPNLNVKAGDGDDRFAGSASWVYMGAGDDYASSEGGSVAGFSGDEGDDTLVGGDENEQFYGGPGDDSIDGGGGIDIYQPEANLAVTGLVIRLDLGTVPSDGFGGSDTIANIEEVGSLSRFDDVVYGDENDNHIVADGGHDLIVGNGGDDFLGANGGPHTLLGGAGDDRIIVVAWKPVEVDGGAGVDSIEIWSDVLIIVPDPADTITHGHGYRTCAEHPDCEPVVSEGEDGEGGSEGGDGGGEQPTSPDEGEGEGGGEGGQPTNTAKPVKDKSGDRKDKKERKAKKQRQKAKAKAKKRQQARAERAEEARREAIERWNVIG